jgi:DNA polymerase
MSKPRHLHLDFETYSEVDLTDVGAFRYANDPSTEILCCAMSIDGREPVIWHPWLRDKDIVLLEEHFDALEDPHTLVYAFNAQFEMAIGIALLLRSMGIRCPELSRFRCVMSMARRACLPSSLDMLAEALGLEGGKDKRGKALMKKFSMLQPAKKPTKKDPVGLPIRRIHPLDEPEEFAAYLEYCKQDVRVEVKAAELLSYFDDPINNANYTLDAYINARGVPVNLDALRHAQKLVEQETAIVSEQFRKLVGLNFTQGEAIREWACRHGYDLPNMQAATIEALLEEHEDLDGDFVDDVIKALRMRAAVSYASIKKIPTMLACAGPHDNRIRGMLNHHGATTGRWTNSLVQFQNMKRPTIKNSEDAYRDICRGISLEMLRFLYGPPLEVISSCIRHFVHDV